MITEAAVFLRDEVARYLVQVGALPQDKMADVLLGNIATLEGQANAADKLILTLVNVEEESALKNGQNWIKNTVTNGIESKPPPVHLNLYLLFSATVPDQLGNNDKSYQDALHRISSVIELFQSKKVFTLQNSPGFQQPNLNNRLLDEIRLLPELYTLTFEQINHLWGSLGGKQSPFVMYKVRLVKIQGQVDIAAPHIDSIDHESRVIPSG